MKQSGGDAAIAPKGHRHHLPLVVTLALASLLRLAVDHHAVPGVYQDSLVYLRLSPHAPFAPFSPTRPSGYPLTLRILDALPGAHLDTVTLVQHLAGVVVGALVYFLVLKSGARRWLAVAAAAVVLLDSYTVALEQDILAETFFTLALTTSAYLTLRRPGPGPSGAVVAGLLLGVACTLRTVGLFVVPVWMAWLLLRGVGRRAVLGGLAGLALPVVAYSGMHAAQGAGFSLVASDGWYLYAKIGPIADCTGASVPAEALALCPPTKPEEKPFEFYLYESGSPAHTLFHGGRGMDLEDAVTPENNRILRRFSLAIIEANPTSFLELVGREFLRYLGPSTAQSELTLYSRPGTLLQAYERWVHVRWWMLTGAVVAALAWVVAGRRGRGLGLLVGLSLALILGAAATSGFNNRYLVPTFPLIAAAGALATDEALRWLEREGEGEPENP